MNFKASPIRIISLHSNKCRKAHIVYDKNILDPNDGHKIGARIVLENGTQLIGLIYYRDSYYRTTFTAPKASPDTTEASAVRIWHRGIGSPKVQYPRVKINKTAIKWIEEFERQKML